MHIRPAIMVANSRKKHRPGTHRSLKAEFISMEAPFKVVLNWILSPKTEFRARQKACTQHSQIRYTAVWSKYSKVPTDRLHNCRE
jgi:hypothetical protein